MPTHNPRLTITLEPTQAALLREMAVLTKQSQSSLVSDLLKELTPAWSKMREVLLAAEAVKESLNETFVKDMDEAQARVEKQLGLCLDELDGLQAPLIDLAEKIGRRKGRGGEPPRGDASAPQAAASTPLSNRGVRSKQKPIKTTTYGKQTQTPKLTKKVRSNGTV